MFFDEVPPDTSVYMIAGYVIFFAITAIYVASLIIRTRNLDKDLEALEGMQEQEQLPVRSPAAPAAPRTRTAKPKSSGKSKQARKKAPKRR